MCMYIYIFTIPLYIYAYTYMRDYIIITLYIYYISFRIIFISFYIFTILGKYISCDGSLRRDIIVLQDASKDRNVV